MWLLKHLHALLEEYNYRYEKTHGTTKVKEILESIPEGIPDIGLTAFAQALPQEYKQKDAVKAYREFYKKEKSHFAKWTKRKKPEWFN